MFSSSVSDMTSCMRDVPGVDSVGASKRRYGIMLSSLRIRSAIVLAIYQAFFDIIMQRRGPQDLPASRMLLAISVALYALVGSVLLSFYIAQPSQLVAELALNIAVVAGFYALVLKIRGFSARLVQTLTALYGCDAILSGFMLPFHGWHTMLDPDSPVGVLPLVGISLLLFWTFAVAGHILRHALEIPLPAGVLVAMAQFAVGVGVTANILGAQS